MRFRDSMLITLSATLALSGVALVGSMKPPFRKAPIMVEAPQKSLNPGETRTIETRKIEPRVQPKPDPNRSKIYTQTQMDGSFRWSPDGFVSHSGAVDVIKVPPTTAHHRPFKFHKHRK